MNILGNWKLTAACILSVSIGAIAVAQNVSPADPTIDFSEQQMDQALRDLMAQTDDASGRQALADWLTMSDLTKKKKFFSGDLSIPYDWDAKAGANPFPRKKYSVAEEEHYDEPRPMGCTRPRICHKTTLRCPRGTTDCEVWRGDCDHSTC